METKRSIPCPLRWDSCGGCAAPWTAPGSCCVETGRQNRWRPSSTMRRFSSPSRTSGPSRRKHRLLWHWSDLSAPSALQSRSHCHCHCHSLHCRRSVSWERQIALASCALCGTVWVCPQRATKYEKDYVNNKSRHEGCDEGIWHVTNIACLNNAGKYPSKSGVDLSRYSH